MPQLIRSVPRPGLSLSLAPYACACVGLILP
nr:MAG TPA: hypothetical protein [Bacteriophage sp.]